MDKNSKVLVLGARGLVGSAIVRTLAAKGYAKVLAPPRSELDLSRQTETLAYFEKHKPDVVFVAAAKVGGIVANNRDRADFLFQNLQIQNHVFEAAFRFDTKELLFLGSSCVYPKEAPQPITEESLLTSPLEPTNEPYAIAKIAGLKLAESFRRQYGRRFYAVMPTNLYGVNDNFHPEDSHVIPGLIARMQQAIDRGDKEFKVWGTGTPRREFLYVDDMAEACVFLMERAEGLPDLLNIGTGDDIAIGELAKMVAKEMGFPGQIVFDPSRPDGMMRKRLDVSKLFALGWRPKVGLEEGLRRTVEFYRSKSRP